MKVQPWIKPFLVLVVLFSFSLCFYALWNWTNRAGGSSIVLLFLVLPLSVGIFFLFSLRFSPATRANIVLLTITVGICLFAAEAFIVFTRKGKPDYIRDAALRRNIKYDGRTKLKVVQDLRKNGVAAYPMAGPTVLLSHLTLDSDGYLRSPIKIGQKEVLPLGGVSLKTTVLCNESGQWTIYNSDEHGFRNPRGIWRLKDLEIVMLGDSFTRGACVSEGEDIGSLIRKDYPKTLVLAMANGGALYNIAYLKEYVRQLKPRNVLWFFYEGNDMLGLKVEKRVRILLKYFNEQDFEQGLRKIQDKIDEALTIFVDEEMRQSPSRAFTKVIFDFLILRDLRTALQIPTYSWQYHKEKKRLDFQLLEVALVEAKGMVESWGGKFHLVYLPSWLRQRDQTSETDMVKQIYSEVKRIVSKHGIHFIDLIPRFRAHENPEALVAYRRSHYSAKGYRLVAERVLAELSKQ